MPVRFEPEQPFAPSIAEGYGRSEVIQRMTPQVYGAANDTARMRLAAAESAADRAERSAARRQVSSSNQMALLQRQTEADSSNLQRAAIADAEIDQRAFEFEGERQLRTNALEFQRAQAQAEMQARQNELRARAELENWQNQQALTFKEQQELRRMQAAVSEVDALPLTDEQKAEMKFRIKTGIDPLERRQRESQQRMLDAHAKQYEAQAALDTRVLANNDAFWAANPDGKFITKQMADGSEVTLVQTGYDQNNRPMLTQLKKEPTARDQAMQVRADLAKQAITTVMKGVADGNVQPGEAVGKFNELMDAFEARLGLRGGPGGGQTTGAEASKSANPWDWDAGFDTSKPATPAQRAFTQKNVADFHRIQNDPRMTQPQKDPYLKLLREALALAAAPGKTPEQKQRLREILQAPEPQPPSSPVVSRPGLDVSGFRAVPASERKF